MCTTRHCEGNEHLLATTHREVFQIDGRVNPELRQSPLKEVVVEGGVEWGSGADILRSCDGGKVHLLGQDCKRAHHRDVTLRGFVTHNLHRAFVGSEDTCEEFQERTLARSVGTEQAIDSPRLNGE